MTCHDTCICFIFPEDFSFPELITEAYYTWDILALIDRKLSTHVFSGIHGTVESGAF